jgi:uncharacterized membrane protein
MTPISMIGIDWSHLAVGGLLGTLGSALFFFGLALGMRLALRARHPALLLLLSAGLRITALLALLWGVSQIGVAALAGFALAFLGIRFVAFRIARHQPPNTPKTLASTAQAEPKG